jgi:hypothetical protein
MLRYVVYFLAIALALPMSLWAAPVKGIGMWVWSESSFSTNEARQRLVQFCVKHHISHLDIHIQITRDDEIPILTAARSVTMPEESNRGWPSGLSKRLKTVYVLSVRRMRRFMEERLMSQ